jgi:RHS repeat-associated protein
MRPRLVVFFAVVLLQLQSVATGLLVARAAAADVNESAPPAPPDAADTGRAPETPTAPAPDLTATAASPGGTDALMDALGTSAGGFTPAQNGAATYRLPIVVPPGTAGLQPGLGFSYNSQNPTSLMGVGWSLDGVPVVVRCRATVAQDGFSGGIKFNANDRFCLMGQRLIAISGGNGADGAEYRTEVDGFTRVISYGVAGSGPASFRAWTKDGKVMEFGVTADSRIEAQGQTSVLVWALNRVQDPSGNYLTVTYTENNTNGEFRPTRIDYTGNAGAGLAPTRAVTFEYATRPDVSPKYISGALLKVTVRLTNVKTFANGALVRDYRVAYDNAGAQGRSRVTTITECSGAGTCMPATSFASSPAPAGPMYLKWSGAFQWNAGVADTFSADLDGDGRSDIIQIKKGSHLAQTLRSNGDGTYTLLWTSPTSSTASGFMYSTNSFTTFIIDANGDGIPDILQVHKTIHQARVLLGNGDGSFRTAWENLNGTVLWGANRTFVGDVNGDGLTDIIQLSTGSHMGRVALSNGDGSYRLAWQSPNDGTVFWGPGNESFVADVNGDGLADLIQISTTTHVGRVALSNGDGTFTMAWQSPSDGTVIWGGNKTYVADVNGDGLPDLIQLSVSTHVGRVVLSNGDGSYRLAWTSPSNGTVFWGPGNEAFVADVNGDGYADLIQISTTTHVGRVVLSKGDGTFVMAYQSPTDASVFWGGNRTVVGDVDGDGLPDLLQISISTNAARAVFPVGQVGDLVTSVSMPLGGQMGITYKPMTDPTAHTKEPGPGYPTLNIPGSQYVVTATTTADGRGGSSAVSYAYGGAKFDLLGRGPLGVRWRRVTDSATNDATTTFFAQTFPLTGAVTSSEVRDSAARLFQQVVHTYSSLPTYPGTFFVRLDQTSTFECDGQATCRELSKSFEYDGYGNLTRTFHWGDVATPDQERDEYTEWAINLTAWLHQPKHVLVYGPGATLLREKWISYDGQGWGTIGAQGLPTREESRLTGGLGSPGNPVILRGHDPYGNPISLTDPRGCTTTTAFEPTFQTYPSVVTTCLGHATQFTYDGRWGKRLSETDPNGQTTTYTYDAFGRLETVRGPLDPTAPYGTVTKQYLNLGNPNTQRIATYRTEQHNSANAIWSEEYFDGLGRAYLTRAEGPTGQVIETNTTYDARGLVASQSAAHYANEAPAYTTFIYDTLRRRTRVNKPDGTFLTMAYAPGLQTATDERGKVKRRHLDGFGRIVAIEEVADAGTYTTHYDYDATGALTRVTNQLGHATDIVYDLMGRKVTVADPNMGAWTYGYDAGSLLTSQTDAKTETLTFEYDLQGRVRFKRYPGGIQIEWTYDDPAVPLSKGRLSRVVDQTAVSTFRYDELGRVLRTDRQLDGTIYTLIRGYDALNRVTSETFPDGDVVTYTFNTAGWLDKVGSFGSPSAYITGIAYNARGQRTLVQYANGVSTTLLYFDGAGDPKSFRLKSVATSGPGGAMQNLAYAYDPVGNVTQITDGVGTATRTFTYDALRRLSSATGQFGPSQTTISETYAYDAIGNILTKGGVTYTYNDVLHPSVVTSTSDGKTFQYDPNGNMLNGGGRALAWDVDNRLAAVTMQGGNSAEFGYDYSGRRVRKVVNAGSVTRYPFAGYEIDPSGVTTKLFAGIARKSGGQTLFYHNDHLGGIHVITDQDGLRQQLVEYTPWGEVSRSEGNADLTHGFTGQFLDPESGLMYYGGRYYDPALGRFINPDPFVPEPGNPQALNRYSYVINNPVNATDPSGFSFFDDLIDFFEDLAKLHFAVDRVVVPIVAGIVVTYFTGGCVPCGAAVAGSLSAGLNTAAAGGGLDDIVLASAIGGAVGFVAGAAGQAAGLAASIATGPLVSTIVGGAVGGATAGALNAFIYGGAVGQSAAQGALIGAVAAGVSYAGYATWNILHSTSEIAVDASPETSGQPRPAEGIRWIFEDKGVQTGLRNALALSKHVEIGGSIVMDPFTGQLDVILSYDPNATATTAKFSIGSIEPSIRIATFHTHTPGILATPGDYDVPNLMAGCLGRCGIAHFIVHPSLIWTISPDTGQHYMFGTTRMLLGQ